METHRFKIQEKNDYVKLLSEPPEYFNEEMQKELSLFLEKEILKVSLGINVKNGGSP